MGTKRAGSQHVREWAHNCSSEHMLAFCGPQRSMLFLKCHYRNLFCVYATSILTDTDNDGLVIFIEKLYSLIDDKSIERIKSSPKIPKTTKKALIDARLGQGRFRDDLITYWNGACVVTELEVKDLLRASHIKPWCESDDEEKLYKFNGLLLSPNLDLAFDKGYITFNDQGKIIISNRLTEKWRNILNINEGMEIQYELNEKQQEYLRYHREVHFEKMKVKN